MLAHQSTLLLILVATPRPFAPYSSSRSPTMYGYVYDFYHEGIQKFYALGRLPIAEDCWQCYHPPAFYASAFPSTR